MMGTKICGAASPVKSNLSILNRQKLFVELALFQKKFKPKLKRASTFNQKYESCKTCCFWFGVYGR